MKITGMANRKGQSMLLLVVVTMIAALGIGTTIATRSMVSQKETTTSSQNEVAFNAADAGIELAISDILEAVDGGSTPASSKSVDLNNDGNSDFEYTVTEVGGLSSTGSVVVPSFNLEKDKIEVFVLNEDVASATISWSNDSSLNIPMEVNLLDETTPGNYSLVQATYNCPNGSNVPAGASPVSTDDTSGSIRTCSVTIASIDGSSFDSASLLSIVPRENPSKNVSITLNPKSGSKVPLQGYEVLASGLEGQSQRNITVLYLLPNLARLFNNTLYAEMISAN